MLPVGSGAISPVSARYAAQLKELLQTQTLQRAAAAEDAAAAAKTAPATSAVSADAIAPVGPGTAVASTEAAASPARLSEAGPSAETEATGAPTPAEIQTTGSFVDIAV